MAMPPRPIGSLVDGPMMPEAQGMEIPVEGPMDFDGGAEVIEQADGSALIRALSEVAEMEGLAENLIPFDANLAEFLDEDTLGEIAGDLTAAYEEDLQSRDEWEETYTKGLDLLGIKTEERSEPFEGASGVTHPLISESVTQFQAQAYKELLPSGGPVKTRIVGLEDQAVQDQATRVKEYMNYMITERMEEYDPDTDQMLFYLPLSGSTFKKVYYDDTRGRPVSKFVPAQDVVVPYTASDLFTTPRITHVLKMTDNDVRKLQVSGFYRDVDLPVSSGEDDRDEVKEKIDEIQGTERTSYKDDVRVILEMHVELDIEGFEDTNAEGMPTGIKLPYIVTLDRDSRTVLSIRRNYAEEDPLKQAIPYFVHYKFMPGLGFYGFGLTHMIGGLGRAATSILRQLIDAGTLSNLPAGFKARGVRVRNDDEPLRPGEWRDMDAPGGNIRDSLIPLPYKEPSATLAQLLGALVEGGRRFVSIADQQVSNMNQEMPVGTTVAMLERGMKVMSAIHKRLHYAQKNEFKILARIIAQYMPPVYPYAVEGGMPQIKQADFDGRVDIIPVSDPNIFSMAQRVALAQTQLQMAQSAPQMHNLHAAYRRMYQALEVQNIDEILPPPAQPQPKNSMIENGDALQGLPLMAFPEQHHASHIQAHILLLTTPLVQASAPVQGSLYAHIMQHISFLARQQALEGAQNLINQARMSAQQGRANPAEVEQQIMMTQQALNNPQELEAYVALLEAQILQQILPQMVPQPPDPNADPLVQIRNAELQLKQQELLADSQNDQNKLMLEMQKLQQKAAGEAARLELQEDIAEERNRVNRERIAATMMMAQQRGQGRG